jgi:hypothetical protein
MSEKKVSGIFSTHLHEIFQLPLKASNVVMKRMGITHNPTTGK